MNKKDVLLLQSSLASTQIGGLIARQIRVAAILMLTPLSVVPCLAQVKNTPEVLAQPGFIYRAEKKPLNKINLNLESNATDFGLPISSFNFLNLTELERKDLKEIKGSKVTSGGITIYDSGLLRDGLLGWERRQNQHIFLSSTAKSNYQSMIEYAELLKNSSGLSTFEKAELIDAKFIEQETYADHDSLDPYNWRDEFLSTQQLYQRNGGNCMDLAMAKYDLLLKAGVQAERMRVVIGDFAYDTKATLGTDRSYTAHTSTVQLAGLPHAILFIKDNDGANYALNDSIYDLKDNKLIERGTGIEFSTVPHGGVLTFQNAIRNGYGNDVPFVPLYSYSDGKLAQFDTILNGRLNKEKLAEYYNNALRTIDPGLSPDFHPDNAYKIGVPIGVSLAQERDSKDYLRVGSPITLTKSVGMFVVQKPKPSKPQKPAVIARKSSKHEPV